MPRERLTRLVPVTDATPRAFDEGELDQRIERITERVSRRTVDAELTRAELRRRRRPVTRRRREWTP